MRVFALLLLLVVLIPVNPHCMGAVSRSTSVIDFGWIDVPFKTNFTITFQLSASKMYIRTDSPWILTQSQVNGTAGEYIRLNVSLIVPADAKPKDYILHIYITPGSFGSVEAQIAYQIRFSVRGISVATLTPRPDSLYLAIYNSYPSSAYIRAKVYVDSRLISDQSKEAPAKGYAVWNITGDFEGRHNITVVAYSNTGYSTKYVFQGQVLPVDVKASVKVTTNGNGVDILVELENRGRDVNVVISAEAWSDERNDTWSQTVALKHGDKVNVTITLHVSLPAFVQIRVIAVQVFIWNKRIKSSPQETMIKGISYDIILLGPIIAAAMLLVRSIRKPRGKFKPERLIATSMSGPIIAIRKGEAIFPPIQAFTLLSLPQVDRIGDGIITSDRVYGIRSTEGLKVYVIGFGDGNKALDLARKARKILARRGADILTEIPPEDPVIDELSEAIFS